MKFLTEKRTIHKIIIAIVFVMLFNFVMPNISLATEAAATAGGILFEPIKDLLLIIADSIMNVLQSFMFGMDSSFLKLTWEPDRNIRLDCRKPFYYYRCRCRNRCNRFWNCHIMGRWCWCACDYSRHKSNCF